MTPPLADYILVAEFDIEKGSTVSFQYPEPPGTDVAVLAELMLPDGAHNRDQDWTLFFLNQPIPESARLRQQPAAAKTDVKKGPVLECYVYIYTESSQGWEMLGDDKRKIRLDQDAIVILDTDRTIQRSPALQYQQMELLYDVIITEDVAVGLRFSEESEEATLLSFLEDFSKPKPVELPPPAEPEQTEAEKKKPFLHCLNLVRTKHIPGVKRGARTKAMAICTQHGFVHVFKPLLLLALDKFFDTPDISVLKQVFDSILSVDMSQFPQLSDQERRIIRATDGPDPRTGVDRRFFATKIPFMGIDIPLKLPVGLYSDEVGDFSVIRLVQKFANSTVGKGENGLMVIFNALLRQQRIIFCGYNMPSGEVANYVLAACAMVAPPLRGFTERAFPYTNLVNLDTMLSYPGFIAGVTNPRFEEIDKWWDVLCNVATGQVKLASHLPPQQALDPHVSLDNEFIADVMSSIQSHYAEERIRVKFQDYVQNIIDLAFDDAEFADDATKKKVFQANVKRVEQWKFINNTQQPTDSFINYARDRQAWYEKRAIKDVDVNRHIRRLRIRQNMSEKEVLAIYQDFDKSINTDEQLIEFLSYLPENQGGLYPVAVSLFHPSESVRRATVVLFNRIDKLKAGSGFINGMNKFLRLAYERNKSLLDK